MSPNTNLQERKLKIENVAAYQGSYSSGTTYYEGDIVTYNAVNYLSLIDSNTGNQPDTNLSDWVVLGIQSASGVEPRYALISTSLPSDGSTVTLATISGLASGTYQLDMYIFPTGYGAPTSSVTGGTSVSSQFTNGVETGPLGLYSCSGGTLTLKGTGVSGVVISVSGYFKITPITT